LPQIDAAWRILLSWKLNCPVEELLKAGDASRIELELFEVLRPEILEPYVKGEIDLCFGLMPMYAV
jgi:hypothetical protein